MNKEREILLNSILQNESKLKSALNIVLKPKSAEDSEKARKKGNALFLHQIKHDASTHEKIFDCFCESVALAPLESQELALAYGNRSYLLLHIHKYEESIKDIDKALRITASDVLKAKLLCRKVECLKKLGFSNVSSILEMVQNLMEKIEGPNKMRLVKMFDGIKALAVKQTEKPEMGSEVSEDKIQKHSHKKPLTDDFLSQVSIKYNKKYGRHLVAAKDYKPGDIIFNEKIYACTTNNCSTYCQYCLEAVWSSIPCSYCSWAMFCSENCKEKAWNAFHDIECTLISHLKVVIPAYWKCFTLHIRVLINGIKETGSIANLRGTIETLDKCTDSTTKGYFENSKLTLNSIKNVYSLTYDTADFTYDKKNFLIPIILISLTKYSKLKHEFVVKEIKDLVMNDDIIFVGSLFIRILLVASVNGFSFIEQPTSIIEDGSQTIANENFAMKQFITSVSSFFSHSCFPTADWRYTDQNTLLLIALQPIKTNSQIFINYGCHFYEEIKSSRSESLLKYNFTCDCQACTESWPPIVFNMFQLEKKTIASDDLYGENKRMVLEVYNYYRNHYSNGKIDEKFLKKLSASIIKMQELKQPSLSYCLLIDLLRKALSVVYGAHRPSFDLCN